jgi:hypothetical protein
VFKCDQQHENKQCTVDKPKCANCKGEHPSSSKTCPKRIKKLLVMKKVLVEKCTPQQARVEIKTQLKPANKPKGKVTKVTENTNNIVLFLAFLILLGQVLLLEGCSPLQLAHFGLSTVHCLFSCC